MPAVSTAKSLRAGEILMIAVLAFLALGCLFIAAKTIRRMTAGARKRNITPWLNLILLMSNSSPKRIEAAKTTSNVSGR